MLQDFTLEQLGLFITLVMGSVSLCVLSIFKSMALSRCKNIKCGCVTCDRLPLQNEELYEPEPERG